MTSWLNRPKITPLQLMLFTGGVFYFLFLNTEFFQKIEDFLKFMIFVGIMLLSYLAGYSAIDSKRLGLDITSIMMNPRKDLPEKFEEIFEKVEEILFQVKKQIKKTKKGEKKNGRK